MRYPRWQLLFLSCILALTIGIGPSLASLIHIAEQASVPSDSRSSPQTGSIRSCAGQRLELSSPQLTIEDLTALSNCSSGAIPQLVTALESQDWNVKVIAAYSLGLLGVRAQSAVPALSRLMQHENADVRFVVAQTLGRIGTKAVVPALITALKDSDEDVRVSGAAAFQNLGLAANPAKSELLAALWDGNWFVRSRAAATISKLGLSPSDIPELVNPLKDNPQPDNGAIISLMLSIYPPIFNKLEDLPLFFIQGLASEEVEVREAAAIGLGQISLTRPGFVRLRDSIFALQKAAKDRNEQVRANALQALYRIAADGKYQDIQVIDTIESSLLKGLNDPDPNVRRIAFGSDADYQIDYAYSSTKQPKVILAALEALQDKNFTVRLSAFNFLNKNLDRLGSLPVLPKPQLKQKISLALMNSLYDQNSGVRQNAGSSLQESLLLPALIGIVQQKNIDPAIRYDAFATIARRVESIQQSQPIVKSLQTALEDPDLGIRVNAAYALEIIGKISDQDAVSIFIKGLKSEDPSTKLHAIFALSNLCKGRGVNHTSRCAETKPAIPFLLDTLKVNSKLLRYAAALAIANIDSKEDGGVSTLETILSEETDLTLREYTNFALRKISSPRALSAMTHVELEDKQARYARTCLIEPFMPVYLLYSTHKLKSIELAVKALENPEVRLSASHSLGSFVSSNKAPSFSKTQFLVSTLTSLYSNYPGAYTDHPVLQSIFKLKGQDIRRSVIYSLGMIGANLLRSDGISYYYNIYNFPAHREFNTHPQLLEKVIKTLISLVANQEENLEIRWMAAAQLQVLNIPTDQFFIEEKLINPAIALAQSRWTGAMQIKKEFPAQNLSSLFSSRLKPIDPAVIDLQHGGLLNQYGFLPGLRGIPGLDFDIYSKQYVHDNRIGCGDGFTETVYTLQTLFNGFYK